MNSPIKINPNDFEYLTRSDQEYLHTIERLYLLNSGQLQHFRILGPWHQVSSSQLNEIVERVAAPSPRPCSRGHVKGLWCVPDPDYLTGPKILKYHGGSESTTPRSSSSTQGTPRKIKTSATPRNKYSIPRKFQIVPKPTPWIIMDPSKKKNFISDDPPDPSYNKETRSGEPRQSTGRSRASSTGRSRTSGKSRASSTGRSYASSVAMSERYVASPFSTSLTAEELGGIVQRVSRPTHASRGGVELHEKYRNKDYVYGSRSCTPDIRRISAPTISSRGGKDIADKFDKKEYVYGSRSVTPDNLTTIVDRVTKPTVASTGGAGKERTYTKFVIGEKKVDSEELNGIIERISKPTVSSRGGVDLLDKNYSNPPEIKKTNIIIPGIDTKFTGRKKVSENQLNQIVERLTTLTPAYKAKYSTNPHVWVDLSARTGPAHQREQELVAT